MNPPSRALAVALLLGGAALTHAQTAGIYTCVNSKGQRITSDRPIAECTDRTQKELNPSGTVKRELGPTRTAAEQAAEDERRRQLAEEKARQDEEKRRDRALQIRYPTRAVFDKERAQALAQVDDVIAAAQKRVVELGEERKAIDLELEFYKKDVSKAPPTLRRRVEDHGHAVAVQRRFIADQESEKKRVAARFDEDLARLHTLWGRSNAAAAAPTAAQR